MKVEINKECLVIIDRWKDIIELDETESKELYETLHRIYGNKYNTKFDGLLRCESHIANICGCISTSTGKINDP